MENWRTILQYWSDTCAVEIYNLPVSPEVGQSVQQLANELKPFHPSSVLIFRLSCNFLHNNFNRQTGWPPETRTLAIGVKLLGLITHFMICNTCWAPPKGGGNCSFAPCKIIRNPESGKCSRNPASTMVWNPESTLVWNPELRRLESGIQRVGSRNPGPSWILLHGARSCTPHNVTSHLTYEMRSLAIN